MKIKELRLQNFKRFTDLTISGIAEDARLVLLIGANGSGKSSVFDAFEIIGATKNFNSLPEDERPINISGIINISDLKYYHKDEYNLITGNYPLAKILLTGAKNEYIEADINYGGVVLHKKNNLHKNAFYGRSAVRYLPRLTTSSRNSVDIRSDSDRPRFYIDEDRRFENDIDMLISEVVEKVFKGINQNSKEQIDEIKALLQNMNDAFQRIFGQNAETELRFKSFVPPADGNPCKILFQKGKSEINYDLLSSGEKEVVNLLFNLFVRSKHYTDTIYFFDEIDAHLNTALQYSLLKEITENWLPENCQLWTASHSLGFIDYARDYDQAAIIDFDNLDFDQPQVLTPAAKDVKVYDISIPKEMMDKLYSQGNRLVVCENENDWLLNSIDSSILKNFLFSGMANSAAVFAQVKADERIIGLRDRDYLTSNEILLLQNKYPNYKITNFYCFENYLYHPDNIAELNLTGFSISDYTNDIIKQKKQVQNTIIPNLTNARRGYEEFRIQTIKPDKDLGEIIDALFSDVLENFYPFFDMKEFFKKNYLSQFNIHKQDLVNTHWFKTQFEKKLQ
jgi:AAA15 family ATPase/GTPase